MTSDDDEDEGAELPDGHEARGGESPDSEVWKIVATKPVLPATARAFLDAHRIVTSGLSPSVLAAHRRVAAAEQSIAKITEPFRRATLHEHTALLAIQRTLGLYSGLVSSPVDATFRRAMDQVRSMPGISLVEGLQRSFERFGIAGQIHRESSRITGLGTFLRHTSAIDHGVMRDIARLAETLGGPRHMRELANDMYFARTALLDSGVRTGRSYLGSSRTTVGTSEYDTPGPVSSDGFKNAHEENSRTAQTAACVEVDAGVVVVQHEGEMATRRVVGLFERLKVLLPALFEEVIFRARAPRHALPGRDVPQAIRAIDLLSWAENASRLALLEQALFDTLKENLEP